jgi:TonB-linked SusC/RagA family outer membrane protein
MLPKQNYLKKLLLLLFLAGSGSAFAQPNTITGVVTSLEENKPLAGVTVIIQGRTTATQTNEAGFYQIQANNGDVLIFSYTGFSTLQTRVGNTSEINVTLQIASTNLDEVVVVGYGTQTRRTLSGSVSSVEANVLQSAPNTNLATVLQGTVSGVRVQQTTGQPGATPNITFRGGTNFDGTGTPLYIVDGIIVPSLFGINMDDVEKIDLLKDAASTAIYGSRASNGVVLVTTKRGKRGRSQVTYSYRIARNYVRRNPVEFLNAEDYIVWNRRGIGSRFEANVADGNTAQTNNTRNQLTGAWGWAINSGWTSPQGLYSTQLLNNSNRQLLNDPLWNSVIDRNPFNPDQMDTLLYRGMSQRELEDLILQQSTFQEHHVNFSGASDQGNFALGLGAMKDVGMVVGSQLRRMNMNFNGGLNVGRNLKINVNLAGYNVKNNPSYLDASSVGNLGGLIQRFGGIAPTVRLTHDITGEILPGVDGSTLGNPLYLRDKFLRNNNEQRFSGGVNMEYYFTPSFKFLASATGFMRFSDNNAFNRQYQNGSNGAIISARNASFANEKTQQYSYNAFLQYDKSFNGHNLSLLGGGEYFNYEQYNSSASASGAATDFIPWLSASTVAIGVPSSSFSQWDRLTSAIGRMNYNYDARYLLTVNMRYDGSSRLGDNRFGLFPGISAGWNLHNESFYDRTSLNKYVSTVKPRISWGENGSITPLGYFATDPTYNNVGTYNGNAGFGPNSLVNTSLKWERVSSLNLGLDVGLLNNRVLLIGDYFIRNVYDKIASLAIPAWTGFSTYTTNLGQLQNKGFELELKVNAIRPKTSGGLQLDLSANYSHVKNYVVRLPDNGLEGNRQGTAQVFDPKTGMLIQVGGLQEGRRVGLDEVWAYTYDGIYKTQEEIDKSANIWNVNLPYTNKRIKMLGDARWRDLDGNDTINSFDRVFVGRTNPVAQGGFSSFLKWKGFSLFAQFDYAVGFVIMNQSWLRGISQVQGSQNGPADIKNTWHPDNTSGTLPRYYWANYGANYIAFANYYQKGDFLAVRELTLSYELSPTLLRNALKQRIQGIRAYVTGSNLAYFTEYNGTLPEVGGDDPGRFPLPRRITLGLNVSL